MREITYKAKINYLSPLLNDILNKIKRELKNEHLRKDLPFSQKYFSRKPIDKITVADLVEGYTKALEEGYEEAGEWISSRWMLKHPEVYQFFADKLTAINPHFDEIQMIPEEEAKKIKEEAVREFGVNTTYIFSVLNSVVFPDLIYEELKNNIELNVEPPVAVKQETSIEDLMKNHQTILAKLTEKYEQKLRSLEKKYVQDREGYKKQIASLQRRLK